jgi:glycosyltransferase involved in cell wall biosynthesis
VISLICTIKNEEKGMARFIESVLKQTVVPDQFVIVDGGSTDRTVEIVTSYAKKHPFISILQKPGCTIAEGRNIAISTARGPIIACTDAGSILEPDWLENICAPLRSGAAEAVSGWYTPTIHSDFQSDLALLTFPKLEHVKQHPNLFLPSGRSIAFNKHVWEEAGGYPEELSFAGEDTLFDMKVIQAGYSFSFCETAIVHWEPREDFRGVYKQFKSYSLGEGEFRNLNLALILSIGAHSALIASLILVFVYPLLFTGLAAGYLFHAGYKALSYTDSKNRLRLFILILVIQVSTYVGYMKGFGRSFFLKQHRTQRSG